MHLNGLSGGSTPSSLPYSQPPPLSNGDDLLIAPLDLSTLNAPPPGSSLDSKSSLSSFVPASSLPSAGTSYLQQVRQLPMASALLLLQCSIVATACQAWSEVCNVEGFPGLLPSHPHTKYSCSIGVATTTRMSSTMDSGTLLLSTSAWVCETSFLCQLPGTRNDGCAVKGDFTAARTGEWACSQAQAVPSNSAAAQAERRRGS